MTVGLVAAVLAGPSLIACSRSPDGLGACLRQRVVDAGLLPSAAPQTVVAAPPAPELEAPASAPTESEPEASLATATPPALTLLRAEPDGSLVVAGTGSPGAEIEIYANGEPLGTATAEPSGDWVVVPEAPLALGGVEITMGEAGSDTLADQSFVVVIDPKRTSEPLVVATRPGEASAVLQGLPRPETPPEEVAAPEPEAAMPMAAPAPAAAVIQPEPEAPSRSAAELPATSGPASVEEPETPDTAVAIVEPEAAEPEPPPAPVVTIPPSIDAIEIDGAANFFAGGGTEGATVRLYVDDRFTADAKVAEGRWLVETTDALTRPSQRVRVDMLKPGTAEVAARAEVNFVVELPATAEPEPPAVEMAQPEPAPASPPQPAIVAEPFDRELDAAADAAATPSPDRDLAATLEAAPAAGAQRDLAVATEAAPAFPVDRDLGSAEKPAAAVATAPDLAQPAKEAGHAEDKAIETANVPDAAVSTPKPLDPSSKPAVTMQPEPAPRAATTPEPDAEPLPVQEPAAAPTTAIAVAPADDDAVPTLRAVPVGDPDAMRFASGKAIIRRGDNLWSIARRVYGDGLKYTTIYRANKDQIRSPSRIYPGQVFGLPLVYDE